MKIGIDISQAAYTGTGVANLTLNLVEHLLKTDTENTYVLFFSSLRKKIPRITIPATAKVQMKSVKLPPTFLDMLWNRLHIFPIEHFIGDIDVFISSDWVQPPTKAKKVTILYDLIVYKYPEETHNRVGFNVKQLLLSPNIVASQKRRLSWVKKECDAIICISQATKKDALKILEIPEGKLKVIYPGI